MESWKLMRKGLFRRIKFLILGHYARYFSIGAHHFHTHKKEIESGLASGSVHKEPVPLGWEVTPPHLLMRIPNNHQKNFPRIYRSTQCGDLSPISFEVQFTKIDRRLVSSFKSLFCLHLSRNFYRHDKYQLLLRIGLGK